MSIADEFPLAEEDKPESNPTPEQDNAVESSQGEGITRALWAQLSDFGLTEPVIRLGTHAAAIALILVVVWAMRSFYLAATVASVEIPQRAARAASLEDNAAITPQESYAGGIELPSLPLLGQNLFPRGVPRLALLRTTIPNRPRVDVITYVVKEGDTVFGIAEKFGLRPETIFWGNREVLGDNPHNLRPGQELNILPVDGVYHKWSAGESFTRVAEFYGVDPMAIISWPGNSLDEYAFNPEDPQIEPGTMLIVPGGTRDFVDWGPPRIPRDDPAVARTYGPGFCGSIYDGAIGNGAFIWPTTATYLSGYDYSPATNHYGLDIAGSMGNPVYAADAGVVVYAGWSNFGYGYLVVLDHGNGWQTLYAHMSAVYVTCGQSVFQGTAVGAVGSTGNSTGPHLHFEMMYNSAKVNPWNYVSP